MDTVLSYFLTNFTQASLVKIALVFFRIIGVIVVCPVLGDKAFPAPAKIGLSVFMALLIFPGVPFEESFGLENGNAYTFYELATLVVKETLVGITIGLVVLFVFMGVQLAGGIMGFQMGMWLAQVFDPRFGEQTPVISQFQYLFAIMLFLSVNGHHLILRGLRQSFTLLPLGSFTFSGALNLEVLKLGGNIFRVGFELGAPVIGVLLLISVAMGLIARVVPELNILIVGIPLKIGIGFLILTLSLPYIANVLFNIYKGLGNNIFTILKFMNP